jgi:uncharacterized membrane protein
MDLLVVVLASLALVPLTIFSGGPVRIALGLIFVLFSPGYTLIAALFPKKDDLNSFERLALSWSGRGRLNQILSVLLIVAIMGAIGTLIYVVHTPRVNERFSEFYILGPEGKAENYPSTLTQGEKTKLIVGIVNHEYEATSYHVDVTIDGEKVGEAGPITLANEEKWEQEVSFAPTKIGDRQEVELLLYEGASQQAYRTLHFWIDVVAPK